MPIAKRWKVAAVAILKNEAPYLEDWLLYHLSLGFGHFLIYDNFSSDLIETVVTKFVAGGVATHVYWPVRAGQIDAYNHALQLLRGNAEWVGFFDIDEYIVLHQHEDIGSFVDAFGADQILLPWRNFTYGGHKSAPGGTDQESYFWAHRALPDVQVQTKHLVKADLVSYVTAHFSRISSENTVLADGTPFSPTHLIIGPSYRGAQINHYNTRSYVENVERMRKGQVDGGLEKEVPEFSPLTAESAAYLDYDASILKHFRTFSLERERWSKVSSTPHRYALMQREDVLYSWNNVPFFFCKSFANYLQGKTTISHGTTLNLISVSPDGQEHELRGFWHNEDLNSVHFRVDTRSFFPFFMGTIHYGDFARRFGFEARYVGRAFEVAKHWCYALDYAGQCPAAIFDLEGHDGAEVVAKVGAELVTSCKVPPGRHGGLIYYPHYFGNRATISWEISGTCNVVEMILGALP